MSFSGTLSPSGFRVVADNALDYAVGAQVTGAGHVGATVRELGRTLHTDIDSLARTVASGTAEIRDVNLAGFSRLGETLAGGFASLRALAGANLAVQAAGFVVVAKQLHTVGGDLKRLREDLAQHGAAVLEAQRVTNLRLESLVDFAERTLNTQEAILKTLVSSRTVEAQQLIRQGWENLRHGYKNDAFSRFQKSLEYDNTVYVAHAQLADIHAERGEDRPAEDHYRRAVAFASGVGLGVHAYARLRLATFLEKQGRFEEGLREVDAMLATEERGEWRLYRAELLARLGRLDAALEDVAGLVTREGSYYAAVLSSDSIARIGPPLIELLTSMDEAMRSSIFATMNEAPQLIGTLEAIAIVRPDVLDPLRVEVHRRDGAELLSKLLSAQFQTLSDVRLEVAHFVDRLVHERNDALRALAAAARTRSADVQAHDAARPQQKRQDPSNRLVDADDFARAVFVGVITAGVLTACAVNVDDRLRLGGTWLLVAVPLSLVLGAMVGSAFLRRVRRVRSKRREQAANADYAKRLGEWRVRASSLIEAHETELRQALDALRQVFGRAADPVVDEHRGFASEALVELERKREELRRLA